MGSYWIVWVTAFGAVLSAAQHLHGNATGVRDDTFPETLPGEENEGNAESRNEGNSGKRRALRHASLLSAPSVGPLASALQRGIFHFRLVTRGVRYFKRSWPVEASSKAAAQMLSSYFAQCLTVVTTTGEGEQGLEELILTLDAAGVPRLLLQRRGKAANRTGNSMLQESCVVHVLLLAAASASSRAGRRGEPGEAQWNLSLLTPFVTATRFHLLLLAPFASSDVQNVSTLLLDPSLPRHFDVLLLLPEASPEGQLVKVFRRCLHCKNGEAGVRKTGWWASAGGFTHPQAFLGEQLRDLHGRVFLCVTMDFAPFIDYAKTQDKPGGVTIPKDSMDTRILEEAARKLNFSYVMKEPSDGQWGYLLENGSWTGTVGTVQRAEADFSMMLSITEERTQAVDFTRAYYVEPMTFVMRKPGPLPPWKAPIKPFSWQVWLMVAISVFLSGPAIWLLLSLTPSPQEHPLKESCKGRGRKEAEKGRRYGLGLLALYMVAPILTEPVPFEPRVSSGRVLCGMWWFFCILTTTLYRGSLIACLTVPERSPTLDTLEQLAASELEWGMLDTYDSGYQLFRASQVPVYVTLFQKMHFYNMRLSMERVLQGGYAFISWTTYFRNLIARDYTDRNGATQVHIASEEFFPGGFGWAFPKKSPYLSKFDKIFQRLIESGVVDKWMDDLIQLSAEASHKKEVVAGATAEAEAVPRAITVYHLQGIFLFTVGGFLMALFALLGEILLMRVSSSSSSRCSSLNRPRSLVNANEGEIDS